MLTDGTEELNVHKIRSETERDAVFEIRRKVFVEEQGVDRDDEFDEFEDQAHHFIAYLNGKPCGAARWRFSEQGIKLERFAVLKSARGKKVGSALVREVLNDIRETGDTEGKLLYLHAQSDVVALYEKFGFKKVGQMFLECGIRHYKMQLQW